MDTKLLLVKSITLLYRESLIPTDENSASLIKTVLETIKLQEGGLTLSKTAEIITALKTTVLEMCENSIDHEYEKEELLQRLRMNCGEDDPLYNSFVQGLDPEMSESSLKRTILNIRKSLHNHFRENSVKKIISKASFTINNQRETIKDVRGWIQDLCSQLEPFQIGVNTKDPAILDDVEIHDVDKVREVFTQIQDEESGAAVFKLGWQGVNRMLDGGMRRGEQWVFGGLQHQWKSGFSLTIFKHLALYNVPKLIDPTKKPLLLRISAEDSIQINFKFLYKSLKENETGVVIKANDVSDEEAAKYVTEQLVVNGFYIRLMSINPSLWTYKDVCNKVVELEAEGYEVQVCMMDYLLKLPTTGCDTGPMGHDIRNMYERIRAFMTSRKILFITPHQLSPDAKMMAREGRQDFVKSLVGGGYYAGSKQIDQVVDGELFIHIEKLNREAYLTIQRGKHRKVNITPDEHLYAVYKFVKGGVVPDDVGKADSMRQKVGGPPMDEGGGAPFHEYETMI